MHGKTLALELLESEFPALSERLARERALLKALDRYSSELEASHDRWRVELSRRWRASDQGRIASEALELSIEDLRGLLSAEQLQG
jgi:hypothetical protein